MVSNERLHATSTFILVEYYILSSVVLLTALSALAVDGLSAKIPFFDPRPNNISFYVGQTATLLCSVRGLETRYVIWRKMSEPNPLTIGDLVYGPDERISIQKIDKKHEWNLIIKNVNKDDAGVYECAVSSREKYKRLVLLRVLESHGRHFNTGEYLKETVTVKPELILSGKDFISKGQPVFLVCNATGGKYEPNGIDWFINGRIVSQGNMPRVRVYKDFDYDKRTVYSTLEIRRSVMSDRGSYVCRGPDSKTASVTIHVLDEEKSNLGKRGFVNDSAIPCCSLKWSKQCSLIFVCLTAHWFTHAWFIT